jgi:lysophospholipase L1-like esterase
MNWHLQVPIPSYPFELSHSDKVISMGSCFAQQMADRLLYYKFSCRSNPYGTLFHPIPLLQNLSRAIRNAKIEGDLFLEREGAIYDYSCHSSIWGLSFEHLTKKLQTIQSSVAEELKDSKLLILTFGTAYQYQLVDSGKIVANCHKQPKNSFSKSLSTSSEIQKIFEQFHKQLKTQNPKIQILLSVSPVRHIREGIHQNNLSKASLLIACEEICEKFKDVYYFPAYEILLDELRDYRFFEKDKVHPNDEARGYIWSKFSEALLSKESIEINKNMDKLHSALNHKPFRVDSDAHQQFVKNTLVIAQKLNSRVDVSTEINTLKSLLK